MTVFRHILLVDAGSTKTQWRLIGRKGETKLEIVTPGINALITSDEQIAEIFDKVKIELCDSLTSEVVISKLLKAPLMPPAKVDSKQRIKDALQLRFPTSDIGVESDLVAAARAICGKTAGVACILGTGSNSCLYDGKLIIANTPPMGYVLGDEGSGTAIGRRLISDAFKQLMPEQTAARFMDIAGISLEEIVNNVYSRTGNINTSPNTYIASFTKIASQMIDDEYIRKLIFEEFRLFISRNVSQYRRIKSLKIGFVGSIAVNFSDILKEAVESFGYKMGKIVATPMDGLARYHSRTSFGSEQQIKE